MQQSLSFLGLPLCSQHSTVKVQPAGLAQQGGETEITERMWLWKEWETQEREINMQEEAKEQGHGGEGTRGALRAALMVGRRRENGGKSGKG